MTRALGWLAALALVIGLGAAFGYAPREAVQGNVQRIMYLHVPAVLTAYLAFALVFAGSLGYLFTRQAQPLGTGGRPPHRVTQAFERLRDLRALGLAVVDQEQVGFHS